VKVRIPAIFPQKALARLELRNDPCPASWKTMKIRIRNPAATMESARVRRYDTFSERTIRYHSKKYGMRVLANCQAASFRSERA
jgi:hypothetical protein